MSEYDVFLKLLKAETEDEVDSVLTEAGYFEHDPTHWPALSAWNNNWTLVGAQNTNPTGALVEKLVNAVDHVLIAGCWRAGIDPESDQAPATITDAARDFFKVRNGRLDSLTAAERTALADNIHFVATGPKTAPNYLIIDKGEGQSPHRFPVTFLSLQGQNKYGIRFVQGINNCGGSAVLRFCGIRKYQLIVSRRNPECPSVPGDTTTELWGFTLVRQLWPEQAKRPRPMFVYLAPGGQIASFRAAEIPVLPVVEDKGKPPKPYRGGLKSGTCIKVYDYAWPTRSLATTNARDELEKYLYSLALPIRIHETRDYAAHNLQTTLSGLSVNIAAQDSEGARVEESFSQLSLQITRPEIGELKVAVTVFRDKDDNGKPFRTTRIPHGVIFTVNGQVHHREAADFIKERLRYGSLDKHMLVAVDCTNMLPTAHAGFFTTSRDRTVDANYRKIIIDVLIHHLTDEDSPLRSALRELNARRRQEQLKDTLNDDEPAKVLQDLVRGSPALAAIFSPGTRIHNPHVPEEANAKPFVGKRFPTFFRLSHEPEGGLVRCCPINHTCRIRFETDAENGYFGRAEDPGSITINPEGINRALTLRNGVFGATFVVPASARVGDLIPVQVEVTDSTQPEPFVSRFTIRVAEEPAPFVGKRYPSFFRLTHQPEGGLVRSCPINRPCQVHFETDAENDYFGRAEDPGSITINPEGINCARTLRNGGFGATFVVPPNARVGDLIPVQIEVTDSTQPEPFVCRFTIRVAEKAEERNPPGTGHKPVQLAMPKVIPVTRDGREIDGKPTVQWGNNNDFNEFTALEISPSGEEEGKYDIFVNMDNIHLANELRRERRASEHPLITYYFKYGLTLVALGMLQEHQRREKKEGVSGGNGRSNGREGHEKDDENETENGDDKGYLARINSACIGIAAVIIPMIQRLSTGPARIPVEA
jgi:hypothetical protein